MFFYITHNSPFWNKLEKSKRSVRVFICGFICYVLLHAFLFSKFAETKENLKLYRNYVYYIFAADLFLMGIVYKLQGSSEELTKIDELNGNALENFPTFQEFLELPQKPVNNINDANSITFPIYVKKDNDERNTSSC